MKQIVSIVFIFLVAGLFILLLPSSTQAQLTRGAISGTIRDASGAVIPGATVRIASAATNISRDVVTNEDGFYRAGALEPATYVVSVEKTGFSKLENRSVEVNTTSVLSRN